jgi:hypothetical protein
MSEYIVFFRINLSSTYSIKGTAETMSQVGLNNISSGYGFQESDIYAQTLPYIDYKKGWVFKRETLRTEMRYIGLFVGGKHTWKRG